MFMAALDNLGGEELKAKWMEKVVNYEIMGTYAQTELGHGTVSPEAFRSQSEGVRFRLADFLP